MSYYTSRPVCDLLDCPGFNVHAACCKCRRICAPFSNNCASHVGVPAVHSATYSQHAITVGIKEWPLLQLQELTNERLQNIHTLSAPTLIWGRSTVAYLIKGAARQTKPKKARPFIFPICSATSFCMAASVGKALDLAQASVYIVHHAAERPQFHNCGPEAQPCSLQTNQHPHEQPEPRHEEKSGRSNKKPKACARGVQSMCFLSLTRTHSFVQGKTT
eukprot:1150428-Pelagomonas_calceolata.AAC.1